jgi:hypothetical protein
VKINGINMKKIITLIYLIGFSALIIVGCSEMEKNIPIAADPGIHGEGVMDKNSPNFHGTYFNEWKFIDCQNCHARNFEGGLTPVNCADASCHPAINIHEDSSGVFDQSSSNFHGRYLLTNSLVDCQSCHGANYDGGVSSPSCATCHSAISVHQIGIVEPASPQFHGKYPLPNGFPDCQQCHGENYTGGISSPTCIKCHAGISVHQVGIADTNSTNFHGKYPPPNGFPDCQQCHGEHYTGGTLSPSCVTCHKAIDVHQIGILIPASSDFHGKNPLSGEFINCQQCHGEDFAGGSISPSCTNCHAGITVHKDGISNSSSPDFHGKYALPNGFPDCQQCHGDDFAGGNLSPSCVNCHPAIDVHKPGIINVSSPDFHGKYQLTNGFTNCQQCHGEDFAGGSISPSCVTCHSTINVHKTGILNPSSADFHGKFLANNGWNLPSCKQCHGTNYAGGFQSPTCLNCHNQPGGPEACNTCHGVFSDPTKFAPPQDLSGNTLTTFKGVGAHANHLYNNVIGKTVECETCHIVPQTLNSTGHLDGNLPAEVSLKGLAIFNAAANANYNFSNLTCANTYCHGKFEFDKNSAPISNQFAYSAAKMEGNKRSVVWNKVDGSEAVCGSCHGLPPIGHNDYGGLSTCSNCHTGVVNSQGQIIDKTKHINGVKNVFGN